MDYCVIPVYSRFKIQEKLLSIFLALEDVFALVPPRSDMVVCAGIFNS
jgi:hypothetical protein